MDMGNFGFQKMMFSFPNHTSNSEDSESEASYCLEENSNSDVSSSCHDDSDTSSEDVFDADVDSNISVPIKKYHLVYNITPDHVRQIEMGLDFNDFIAIIFLLFETDYALQEIRLLIEAGPERFSRHRLSTWALTQPENWVYKLYEALAIIQNHQALMKLGLSRQDISVMRNAPAYISRCKKVLFTLVCDNLKRQQAQELIDRVRCDAKFEHDITLQCDPTYIEFHVLFWISQKYIDIERESNLHRLTVHLELMGLLDLAAKISEEMAVSTKIRSPKRTNYDEKDCYKITDPNKPGLVVVINNANFEKNVEKREEFQDKVCRDNLSDRKGTEADVMNLKKTFGGLKYTVVVRNDVFHDELENEIYEAVKDNFEVGCHSILILCVLSHGDSGVVFGANSVPVKNEEIINSVSGTSRLIGMLAGVPKVIIIQACQGKNFMYGGKRELMIQVPDCGDDVRFDGPRSFDPSDRVICMATVQGFVAMRRIKSGTFYIQELCRCVEKYRSSKHFMDIMTKVRKNLSKKNFLCMIPEDCSTLRKLLFLTTE